MSLDVDDARMLRELLATVSEDDDARFNAKAFREMLARDRDLTHKQRVWLRDTHEKVCDTPHYENLVSSGKMRPELIEAGRRVPLPDVLRPENLPKKPPVRRREEA